MADGGVRIVFDSQEIRDPAELAALFSMKKEALGFLLFKESEIIREDIPDYDPDNFDEKKSPSERLRAVMYVFFKEQKKQGDFDSWYRGQMEKMIERYKEKLP
jgi:hypothetical protein